MCALRLQVCNFRDVKYYHFDKHIFLLPPSKPQTHSCRVGFAESPSRRAEVWTWWHWAVSCCKLSMSSFNFDGEKSVPASSCKLVRLHALVTVGVMRLILTCNFSTNVFRFAFQALWSAEFSSEHRALWMMKRAAHSERYTDGSVGRAGQCRAPWNRCVVKNVFWKLPTLNDEQSTFECALRVAKCRQFYLWKESMFCELQTGNYKLRIFV